jgi:hypothetical protein
LFSQAQHFQATICGMTLRLLSLSTLYPASVRPGFGRFVARQMEALAARPDWDVTVINPIGLPPLPAALMPHSYESLRAIPMMERRSGVPVHHPRFTLLPGLSGRINPALITRAVLPLARRLHAEQPFDLVDAQFFYPDGPAAARIARALGLPYAIKARGSDIHVWGRNPAALRQMQDAARGAGALLSVSQALADDMADLGLPDRRSPCTTPGLTGAASTPARAPPRARSWPSAFTCRPKAAGGLCRRADPDQGTGAGDQGPGRTRHGSVALAIAGTGPDEAAPRTDAPVGRGASRPFPGRAGP